LNLLAICDGLANAEADEVVARTGLIVISFCERPLAGLRADDRVRFTICLTLTINLLNDGGIQS